MRTCLALVLCKALGAFSTGCGDKPQQAGGPAPSQSSAGQGAKGPGGAKSGQKRDERPSPAAQAPVPAPKAAALPVAEEAESVMAPTVAAAQWLRRSDAMKWVGLAMHNYASVHHRLPPAAIRDAQGKPLLSWRVAILRFFDDDQCQAAYRQFKLDEPWDSEHNRKLVEKMPWLFRIPGRKNDGKTTVQLYVGPGAPFGKQEGPRFGRDFIDGLPYTLMAVDAGPDKAVPWSKPEDLPFTPKDCVAALGSVPDDGFLALFADGRVCRLPKGIKSDALAALVTGDGGEPIGPDSPAVRASEVLYTRAKPADAARAENPALTESPEAAFLCDGLFAAAVIRPKATLMLPTLLLPPPFGLLERLHSRLGIDAREVRRLVLLVDATPGESAGPGFRPPAVVLQLARPFTAKDLDQLKWRDLDEVRIAGRPCYRVGGEAGGEVAVYFADMRTAVCAPQSLLEKMLARDKRPAPLAAPLARLAPEDHLGLAVTLAPLDGRADRLVSWATGQLGAYAGKLAGSLPPVEWIAAGVDLRGETLARVEVRARDEAAAGQLEKLLQQGLADAKTGFEAARPWIEREMPPKVKEVALELGEQALAAAALERQQQTVLLSLPKVAMRDRALQRLDAVYEFTRQAIEKAQPTYVLKYIGLAMHNYLDSFRKFPPAAICDKQGKPLLSWRVAILPYLEQGKLYDEFRLDEPWDSEHNKKLLARMPALYATAGPREAGRTSLMVFTGGGAPYDGGQRPRFGTDKWHTIMVVDAGPDKTVPWTKPEDLTFDPQKPLAALGTIPAAGIPVLFVDASARMLPRDIAPEVFKALVTGAGLEKIDRKTLRLR